MPDQVPAAAAADTLVSLMATLKEFWPDGEIELVPGSARTDAPVAADTVTFGVAPGLRSPRLLVPLAPRRATSGALLRFSAAATYRDAGTRLAAAAAARIVGPAAVPDRIVVRDPGDHSLAQHLSEVVGREVRFSLGIGNARVNRKPVLQLFDERGAVVGFAKIGDSPLSRSDVNTEASNLRRIAEVPWRRLVVPAVLHETSWQGLSVLVISALAAGPLQATRNASQPPVAAMDELAAAFDGGTSTLERMPWWRQQQDAVGRLSDLELGGRAIRCLQEVEHRAGDREWRIGAWHGDWTSWNMASGRRGQVRLWDWERFETGVPAGLDALHFVVNASTKRHGADPASIRDVLPPPGTEQGLLADLYLVAVTVRYLSLAETSRGEHIVDRGRLVLDVLAERLGLTSAV